MDIAEIRCKGVSRPVLHEDRDQWQAVVNVVMNLEWLSICWLLKDPSSCSSLVIYKIITFK
jgi:hypothetical protein